MANNFQNSFTGKNTGVLLPSGDGLLRSQEKMNDLIAGAEKLKYETYKRNEEEFLKASNIDPVFVLANSARDVQAKMLDQYNTKWGKVMQSRGGNLTTDDKMQMAKEKDYILMEQQKAQSDMSTMQLHQKMVAQNPNRWDDGQLNQWVSDYMKTGHYDHTEPPIKPLSLTDAAMKNMSKVATKEYHDPAEDKLYDKGGVPYKDQTTYSAQKQDVIPYIQASIANNDQYAAGTIKEWNELGTVDKEKYHKANPGNPLLEMAVDRHWKEWVKQDVKTTRNTVGGTSSGGDMRTWQGQKYTPTSAMESPFPGLPSKDYHPVTNLSKQITIPIGSMELLEPTKAVSGVEKPNQSIKGFVTGYDKDSDKITFLISQDYKDLDYASLASGKGMQIAVPRGSFSKEIFDNLEIVDGGKLIKLKDLQKPAQTPTFTKKKLY